MEPGQEVIDGLKAKFPNRSLHLVEAFDGDESYHFVMTGPNREEYRKLTDELLSAKEAKDDRAKNDALRTAVERAALAMIRWPDRDVVQELFAAKPAMSANFAEELHKSAGSNFEVRSKKL